MDEEIDEMELRRKAQESLSSDPTLAQKCNNDTYRGGRGPLLCPENMPKWAIWTAVAIGVTLLITTWA